MLSQDDDADSSPTFETLVLSDYLQDCLDQLDQMKTTPSINGGTSSTTTSWTVTRPHRKNCLRGLLGISKLEMDQQLRETKQAMEWQRTLSFVHEYLRPAVKQASTTFMEQAPNLQTSTWCEPQFDREFSSAAKFRSYLARGRNFQGQFVRLLQSLDDELPDYTSGRLLPRFKSEVQAEISETQLLTEYIHRLAPKNVTNTNEPLHNNKVDVEELLQCVEGASLWPTGSTQAEDGGQSQGRQGEQDLQSYLQQQQQDTLEGDSFTQLSPVWIKVQNSHKNAKKNQLERHILELPLSKGAWINKSSELDTVVVRLEDQQFEMEHVWEAKATLHPTILYQILTQKYQAIQDIYKCGSGVGLWTTTATTARQRYWLKTTPSSSLPQLGIFGRRVLSPRAALHRLVAIYGEQLLQSSCEAAREACATGRITIQLESIRVQLQQTLELVHAIQPHCVVLAPSPIAS